MSVFFLATETWWFESFKRCNDIYLSGSSNSIFSKLSGSNCCLKVPIGFLEFWKINRLKSIWFFLRQNPGCTKVSKTDFDTDLTFPSNFIFCVATGLVSPINVSVKSSTVVVEGSKEEFFNFILELKSWCPETHWRFLVLNNIDFQIIVSPVVEAWFLQSRSRSTKIVFELTFSLKRCQFSSLQQKPDGAKVSKDAMHFDLSRFSKSIFPKF